MHASFRLGLPSLIAVTLLVAPARGAEDHGRPCCDYCRMILVASGKGFGGTIETVEHRRLIFDSTECMAAYVVSRSIAPDRILAIRSVDHDAPDRRIPAERARYLRSHIESPMGMGLTAHADRAHARAEQRRHPGKILTWNQVQDLVRVVWYRQKK